MGSIYYIKYNIFVLSVKMKMYNGKKHIVNTFQKFACKLIVSLCTVDGYWFYCCKIFTRKHFLQWTLKECMYILVGEKTSSAVDFNFIYKSIFLIQQVFFMAQNTWLATIFANYFLPKASQLLLLFSVVFSCYDENDQVSLKK